MQQLYHDAMATVRKLGKPDLFIAFTCNPTWIEIKEAILPNQSPSDRPDMISRRVLRLKLNELLNDIQKRIFGKVIGLIHVIEIQKIGLPHAHILLMLHPDDNPHTPDDNDSFACAELPNQEEEPELYWVNGIISFHT
jgi:ATP-dependent DNA helicase PIF1